MCINACLISQSLTCMISVLQKGDVLKVDIGVHVNGRICDSAFTLTFEPTYNKLLEAVKAATDTGIRVNHNISTVLSPSHICTGRNCFI